MNYELAKELKEAGFPQPKGDHGTDYEGFWCTTAMQAASSMPLGDNPEAIYLPTLEGLIEACGKQFRNLAQHEDGEWTASMYGEYNAQVGNNPSEAVAKLWLALNKK